MVQDKETPHQNTGISPEQLQEILTTVIAAVKSPTATEQKKLDEAEKASQQAQRDRKDSAASVMVEIENKRAVQRICSHEHADGQTHCVWIQEPIGPGYILCQKEQCQIRPGVASPNYRGSVIYDNDLFNKLFQKCGLREQMFG